jgi:hypothetical protein
MRLRTVRTASMCVVAIACSMGIRADANVIPITYSFTGGPTAPPVMMGSTLIIDGFQAGSILSANPGLNAIWNPVTYTDHSVVDLTTGLLNGTVIMTFADGNMLFGNLFEDVTQVVAMGGTGPFTQILTFTGGTGEFAGATGSVSGAGVAGNPGTSSGSGTLNAPAIPEPASAALFLGGMTVMLVGLRRSKVKISSVRT